MSIKARFLKPTAMVVVALILGAQASAHPGPEPHPIVADLEREVATLESAIRRSEENLLDRLTAAVGEFEQAADGVDDKDVRSIANETINHELAGVRQWLELVTYIGAPLLALSLGLGLRRRRQTDGNAETATKNQPTEEDTEMQKSESPIRLEIRQAPNGQPYLAIIFAHSPTNEVLAKSESYASGKRPIANAIRRLQEGAATAEIVDRFDEGPIGDAAEED